MNTKYKKVYSQTQQIKFEQLQLDIETLKEQVLNIIQQENLNFELANKLYSSTH